MKRYFETAGLSLMLAATATFARAAGAGTTGAQFLEIGAGARPLAMGGAFSALADDANSMLWNPGGMGKIGRANVTASYNSLFQDENQGFLAYAVPMKDQMGVWGAGVNYLSVANIQKRAADTENPDSTFANTNFALMGSYGRMLGDSWSIGGNLKYIREMLDAFSGNSVAIDAGGLYKTGIENLTAGLSMTNLGTKIGPDPLPLTFKGGAAYKMLNQKLALASDVDWLAMDKRAYWALGSEYWVNKAIAFRMGYQFGRGADQLNSRFVGAGIGMGLKLEFLALDYAFLPFGNLGNTHRVTVGWYF